MKKTIALLLALLPAAASAQTFPTVPSQTVIGRTAFGTGPAQAIPFSTITANLCNAFTTTTKGCVPAPATATGRYLGDDGAWHAQPTQQVVAGSGVTLGGTCSGASINCTVNASASTQYVVPSRTAAAASDLSALSAVRTLGYATGGDGGDATFVKIASQPFKDTYVLTGTVTAGSGYTNGTYPGVNLTGGSSSGCRGTVTVAGTVVTAVNIAGNYCAAYAVGDVLSITQSQVGGTGGGASFTVATISTPLGSFVDAAANRWQVTTGGSAWPNVKQFGAKLDYNGVDATATNDLLSFRSAIAFANVPVSSPFAISDGSKLLVPQGAAYLCDGGTPFETLNIPRGVSLIGAGPQGGSTLKQCAAEAVSVHFISLCNPFANVAGGGQFGCALKDITLYAPGSVNNGVYMVYSNSGQQHPLLDNVYMVTGSAGSAHRGCIHYEIGVGGASNAIFQNIDCERGSTGTNNVGMLVNSSNTQVVVRNAVFGCAPSPCAAGLYAIVKQAGNLIADTVHIENHVDGIIFPTNSTDLNSIRNVTIGAGCVAGITLDTLNPNNTVLMENIQASCSTATVVNGHAGGVNFTGNIMKAISCNPGNPCD